MKLSVQVLPILWMQDDNTKRQIRRTSTLRPTSLNSKVFLKPKPKSRFSRSRASSSKMSNLAMAYRSRRFGMADVRKDVKIPAMIRKFVDVRTRLRGTEVTEAREGGARSRRPLRWLGWS